MEIPAARLLLAISLTNRLEAVTRHGHPGPSCVHQGAWRTFKGVRPVTRGRHCVDARGSDVRDGTEPGRGLRNTALPGNGPCFSDGCLGAQVFLFVGRVRSRSRASTWFVNSGLARPPTSSCSPRSCQPPPSRRLRGGARQIFPPVIGRPPPLMPHGDGFAARGWQCKACTERDFTLQL